MKNKIFYFAITLTLMIGFFGFSQAKAQEVLPGENNLYLASMLDRLSGLINQLLVSANPASSQASSLAADITNSINQIRGLSLAQQLTGSVPQITRNLALGSRGSEVKILQEYLKGTNKVSTKPDVTSYFGTTTRRSVIELQRASGVAQIGIVGPQTRNIINRDLRDLYSSPAPTPAPAPEPDPIQTPTPAPQPPVLPVTDQSFVPTSGRAWNTVVLYSSPAEEGVADYLIQRTAVAYPNIKLTKQAVNVTPNTGSTSNVITKQEFYSAYGSAIAAAENRVGSLQMVVTLWQQPDHVSWGAVHPGAMCGVNQGGDKWALEGLIEAGFRSEVQSDSPPSFNASYIPFPNDGVYMNGNWAKRYMVGRLEGVDEASVRTLIDRATSSRTTVATRTLVEAPGKAGQANNGPGPDTYWENEYFNNGGNINIGSGLITNQWSQYSIGKSGFQSRSANTADGSEDWAGGALPQDFLISSSEPVNLLVSYGKHSNGDGAQGPSFSSPTIYNNLVFARGGILIAGESFSGYDLTNGVGGTNLGQWLQLPASGGIYAANEPCSTNPGINLNTFAKNYVQQGKTFGEAVMMAQNFTKSSLRIIGLPYMTVK